jgi:hypothetical protein
MTDRGLRKRRGHASGTGSGAGTELRDGDGTQLGAAGATMPRTDSSCSSLSSLEGFPPTPSLERMMSTDVLADTILDLTLRRRRFVLLVGLALGFLAPLALHNSGAAWQHTSDGKWLEDFNLTNTFSAYIRQSKTAFDRARAELTGFAPADLQLLYQLQEVMDFTKESKPQADALERPGTALFKKGLRAKHPIIMVPGKLTRGRMRTRARARRLTTGLVGLRRDRDNRARALEWGGVCSLVLPAAHVGNHEHDPDHHAKHQVCSFPIMTRS